MKEYKVGEEITLVVIESFSGCEGCFFNENDICHNPTYNDWAEGFRCGTTDRSDGKDVIFVEKEK